MQGELAIMPQKQIEYEILNGIVSFTPLEIAKKIPSYITKWTNTDPREDQKYFDQATYEARGNRIVHF